MVGDAGFDATAAEPVRAARDAVLVDAGAVLHAKVPPFVARGGWTLLPHAALEARDRALPGVNWGAAAKNCGERMAAAPARRRRSGIRYSRTMAADDAKLVARLAAAQRGGDPVAFAAALAPVDLAAAYAAQAHVAEKLGARGRRLEGRHPSRRHADDGADLRGRRQGERRDVADAGGGTARRRSRARVPPRGRSTRPCRAL